MLICKYALDAELLAALLAIGLNGLDVGDMPITVLCDDAILINQWLVGFHI